MSENCSLIIDSLIEQRRSKGMTQKELAKASSLTQSVIARLESKKATPQLDTLLKVASALGCDIAVIPSGKYSNRRQDKIYKGMMRSEMVPDTLAQ